MKQEPSSAIQYLSKKKKAHTGAKSNKGAAFWVLDFNASRSNGIYQDSATTVDVNANRMLLYFYVGEKQAQS